ncbi:DUF998 domain-containing protein [Cryobacterium algoritolerans]|uniref:DUF998 domain-containing protein n=1 Tax=Cryobacterium algoritolerans TaxID=1259184 RepID=A0A4R8WUZ0_9MICO|nr:DUF998 domain-containing protein [Cryobacterium algoritolerans]TFC18169.1 DUF998 domain-containing protein [Cryobacterium algoritolerans]
MIHPLPGPVGRRSATLALAGVIAYVLVDVVLQLLPPHYNPISAAESNLAVGPFGWVMNLNFLGRAASTGVAVVAIGTVGPASRLRRAGLALLLCGGACSAVLAFLPADVPATGDLTVTDHTPIGIAHLAVASTGFLAALAGVTALTVWLRGSGRPRAFPAAAALAVVAATGLLTLGLATAFAPALLGLAERVCLAGILGWTFSACAFIRFGRTRDRSLAR